MTVKEILLKEIEDVPEAKLQEVVEFVRLLKTQNNEDGINLTLVSEPSLAVDWLKEEEDKAWSDLGNYEL